MAKRPRTIRDFWKIRTCKFLESDCDPLDKAELAGQVIRSLGIDEDDRPSCPATDAEVAILEACFQALRCLRAQPRTSDLQKEITALEGQVKELTTEMEEMKSRLSSMEG